jgi:bifunctional ADP-heptose synthase (sugar kinase/adenylyltransferase)
MMESNTDYLNSIKEKFDFNEVVTYINKASKLSVLVIGDTVLDKYTFVWPKGRAVKDPILSTEFISEETYAGGVLAVANHISSYVNRIKLVTLLGGQNTELDFISKSLAKNIELAHFIKPDSPTIVKKRYIDFYRNHKLFKVEYMNDKPISQELSIQIIDYLVEELPKYDLVIVLDYAHGFLNNEIKEVIEKKSKFLSINVQSNSANMGYNYVNHYKNPHFISIDEQELRLPLMMRFEKIGDVINRFQQTFGYSQFLVTVGRNGCIFMKNGNPYNSPIFTKDVVDTVGAGDAVFAVSSLFAFLNAPEDIIPFIANCVGGIKVKYLGNKESVTKEKLIKFIDNLYTKGTGCL